MAIAEADVRSKQSRKNYKIVHFYIEPGVSGRNEDRHEFLALKRAIRRGDYRFIAFKEISRITRESRVWKEFFLLCQNKRCEVVIKGLPIDPNDPGQTLQLDILAAFAEYEARQIAKRIHESVFSAMLNGGKFNATHKILGLDQLVVSGVAKPGFYSPNDKELKTVTWIMETFVKYGSHQKTLDVYRERGILNKTGLPFERNSLITLLTNPKLIGKWYLNEENKDLPQDDLPADQRYYVIDLPHGPLISETLWR